MQTGDLDIQKGLNCNLNSKVDAEGPLVRLKNLLLNQDTLLTIAQWVTVRLRWGEIYFETPPFWEGKEIGFKTPLALVFLRPIGMASSSWA